MPHKIIVILFVHGVFFFVIGSLYLIMKQTYKWIWDSLEFEHDFHKLMRKHKTLSRMDDINETLIVVMMGILLAFPINCIIAYIE